MLARDLTLRGLFDQLTQAITNIDGRLIRSLRYLVARPGFLTAAYLRGQRMPYIGPVQLFLIANVLFFTTESLSGGKVFTTPLDSHLHTQPWSSTAELLVTHRLEAKRTTLALYSPLFDRAMAVNARSFIMLMALSFAPVAWAVFRGNKRSLFVHTLFSLHLYAFMLLLLCVATSVPRIDLWLGGAGFASERLDHIIAVVLLAASAIYLYVAMGKVYGTRGFVRALKTALLTVGIAGIVLGYRFTLLLFTLYTT